MVVRSSLQARGRNQIRSLAWAWFGDSRVLCILTGRNGVALYFRVHDSNESQHKKTVLVLRLKLKYYALSVLPAGQDLKVPVELVATVTDLRRRTARQVGKWRGRRGAAEVRRGGSRTAGVRRLTTAPPTWSKGRKMSCFGGGKLEPPRQWLGVQWHGLLLGAP